MGTGEGRLAVMARKIAAVVFPWPAPHERKAAIEHARAQRHRAEQDLVRARRAQAELEDIVYRDNSFASLIAAQIARGGRP
jgi:hypothetical protein